MISVLIPTYNYDVTNLVNKLHKQLMISKIRFEIIIFDDGSHTEIANNNCILNNLNFVNFKINTKNVGLSNNRNLLAKASIYEYILFIDGDSLITNENYINNYIDVISKDVSIIYGGRVHPKEVSKKRKLRWKYGREREELTAKQRNLNLYKCVFCNNTLMTKTIFNAIGFEKTLKQYGHEDTLFAFQASQLNANILHINNPILHGDVDFSDVFIDKIKKGLNNLDYIYKSNLIDYQFIPILTFFQKLKHYKLNYILSVGYYLIKPIATFNLTSKYPSLFLFDLYRISYFCNINLKQ